MEKRDTKTIVLVAKSLGKRIDDRGRVEVESLTGTTLSLKVRNIKDIYYKGMFYILYDTENAEFYEKYSVQEVPRLAVAVTLCTVEDLETEEKWIQLEGDEVREVKEFVNKFLNKKLEFEDYLYGSTPTFTIEKINDIELFSAKISGVATVDNPVFMRKDGKREIVYQGSFLIIEGVEKSTGSVFYVLFNMHGEGGEDFVEAFKKGIA